jgi:2-keto-4-pentenoate hydratase/2-oxohepta-3-ene-1,7-dioic acid hydratase in catechol pathway
MRLATLLTSNGPRAAALLGGVNGDRYVDLSATDASIPNSVKAIIADPALLKAAAAAIARPNAVTVAVATATHLAPVPDPQKVVCIGLNYRDHAIESKMAIPKEPVLFSKFPSSLVGHGAAIVVPNSSTKVDYEAELVIVVGKRGRHIPEASAMEYVAGYAVGHDVSARDWQLEKDGKQWMIGKTFDTFAPVGPTLVTKDEVPDVHALGIRLRLNGKTMQNSSTEQMIFTVAQIISYISQVFTVEPGDLIFTGTPPGIGHALTPPVYLKGGDVAEVEIDGLGTLSNPCVAG